MLTTSSVVLAVIGLVVWVVRYLISRNSKDVIEGKNAQETIDAITKGNAAVADDSYDDKLRDKYNK
jgi:high-affinity Fe2+/Pb2+ permease